MALSYREVKDLYDTLADSGAVSKPMSEWSREMDALSGSDIYSAGQDDNWIKRTSVGIDRLLEATGLPDILGNVGETVGGWVGNPTAGRSIGHGAVRGLLDFAPLIASGGAGWLAKAGAYGATGLLSGANAYTATGSPASGVISGATSLLMPGVANLAERAALKGLGVKALAGPITEAGGAISSINRYLPDTIPQGLASMGAGQLAAAGFSELSRGVEAGFDPNREYEFSPSEALLGMTLGQAPFAAIHLGKGFRQGLGGETTKKIKDATRINIDQTRQNIEVAQGKNANKNVHPIEHIPNLNVELTPTQKAQQELTVNRIRGQQVELMKDPTEVNLAEYERLRLEEERAWAEAGGYDGLGIVGAKEHKDNAILVTGMEVPELSTDKLRVIRTPEGKLFRYFRKGEPNPVANEDGTFQYSMPNGFFSELTPKQSDLPDQPAPAATLFETNQYELAKAQREYESATSLVERQQAMVRWNHVRGSMGLRPVVDKQMEQRAKAGDTSYDNAVKGAMAKDARSLDRQAQREQVEAERDEAMQFRADMELQAEIDEAAQAEVTEVRGLEEFVSAKAGQHADAMLAGELNRRYHQWTEGKLAGQKGPRDGGFALLRDNIVEAARTGKGIVKSAGTKATEAVAALPDEPSSQPLKDIVAEEAVHVDDEAAQKAFDRWEGKRTTDFLTERERFLALYQEFGESLWTKPLAKDDFEDVNEPILGDIGFGTPEEMVGFAQRPHVQVWRNEVAQRMNSVVAHSPVRLPAGGGFVWDIQRLFRAGGKLANPKVVRRDGTVPLKDFNAIMQGEGVAKGEQELYRLAVPEAFNDYVVNVGLLAKELGNRVQVEVKKISNDKKHSAAVQRLVEIGHQLDTEWPNWWQTLQGHRTDQPPNERAQELSDQWTELNDEVSMAEEMGGRDASYDFVGPKNVPNMPGYVEGLVRVPTSAFHKKFEKDYPGRPDSEKPGIKYRGPHFGSEDTNVLAFFRGYEEMVEGRKVFYVIEVQSDWAQKVRSEDQHIKDTSDPEGHMFLRGITKTPSHPMLPSYESLALKAAIDHARSVGADAIMLSDAETAMMTEGHDRVQTRHVVVYESPERYKNFEEQKQQLEELKKKYPAPQYQTVDSGGRIIVTEPGRIETPRPSQEGGMTLHYNTTLPSHLRALTGEPGTRVDVGSHKMAQSDIVDNMTNGSPVFKNPDGTPKSNITGTLYPLAKAFAKQDAQGGFTLAGKSSAPYVPKSEEEARTMQAIGTTGAEALATVAKSLGERGKLAASWLTQYPEMLGRFTVKLVPGELATAEVQPSSRQGIINLPQGILSASPEVRDFIIMHEVSHQLSLAELANPTKVEVRTALDAMRQEMVNKLSAEDKVLLAAIPATKSGAPLHPDAAMAQVLYGLQDVTEFVAQGQSSKAMKDYLQKQERGGTWSKFKNLVRRLVGLDPKNTAYDEFLEHTNALFDQGEYVASFHNFAERFYQNKGASAELANVRAQRALGLVLDSSVYNVTPRDMIDLLDAHTGQRSSAFQKAKREVDVMVQQRGEEYQGMTQVMAELGYDASRRGLDDLANEAANGEDVSFAMDLLPASAARYVFEKLRDSRDVLEGVAAASVASNKGLVNLTEPEAVHEPAKLAMKQLDAVLVLEKAQIASETMLRELNAVEPVVFANKWLTGQAPIESAHAPTFFSSPGGEKPKGFFAKLDRFFRPIAQYTDQMFKEASASGWKRVTDARNTFNNALKVFGIDFGTGKMSKEQNKTIADSIANPRIQKAVDSWLYENQKAGQETNKISRLPQSDSRVAPHLANLTAAERAEVGDLVVRQNTSKQVHDIDVLKTQEQISKLHGAELLGRLNSLKVNDNVALASTMWDILRTDQSDPVAAQKSMNDLTLLQSKMLPEDFDALYRSMQNDVEAYKLQEQHFADNPGWASAQRTGQFRVQFFKDGKLQTQGALNEADAIKTAGGKDKIKRFWKVKTAEADEVPHYGVNDAVYKRLNELDQEAIQLAELRGVSPDEIASMKRTSRAQQFARESEAQGVLRPDVAPSRGLTRGAQDVPFLSNHFTWLQKSSHYWATRLFKARMDAYISQREMPDDVKADLRTHRDNLLMADPESIQTINQFARTWYMGFNAANVIVNSVQPFVTHVAELTSMTGKPVDSYRRVLSAAKDIANRFLPWGSKSNATPELDRFDKEALDAGEVGLSQYDDESSVQDWLSTNLKRRADEHRPKTFGQTAGSLLHRLGDASMQWFRHGEQLNNRIALRASFKLFREQGDTYDVARDKAFEFNRRVNFGGGRAQRPIGAFSSKSPVLRGAAMLGTAMQSYVLGTTFQLIRYLKAGGFRPNGFTPHEKYSARLALVHMLGTQLAAAGLLGLPFVSGALSLLDKAFPEAEVNRRLREFVHGVAAEDEENGSLMTDIAMTGVPSMLGWDLQSRLSMGNTVPGVSEHNGFQPENLLGPPVGLMAQFFTGAGRVARGEAGGGRAFIPSGIKKLADFAGDSGSLKDYKERTVLSATPGENLGRMLGFNPKRLSDFNQAQRMAELTEINERKRESDFKQEMAEQVLKGNLGTVRQAILRRAQEKPGYDPTTAVRGIATVAEELTFPRDLRREGATGPRGNVLSLFSLDASLPLETQRSQFKANIERQFGLSPSVEAQREAQLMDQLRAQNPSATRLELRRAVQSALRVRRRSSTLGE